MARAATNHLAGGGGGQLIAVAVRPRPTFPRSSGPREAAEAVRGRRAPSTARTSCNPAVTSDKRTTAARGGRVLWSGRRDLSRRAGEPWTLNRAPIRAATWLREAAEAVRGRRAPSTAPDVVQPRRHELQKATAARRRPAFLEREKGFEPSTSTLARWHSTAELLPRKDRLRSARRRGCQAGSILPRERGPAVRFEGQEPSGLPRV
jgi:hypothetical protein